MSSLMRTSLPVPGPVRTALVSSLMWTSLPVPVLVWTALVITCANITPIAIADSTCVITYVDITPRVAVRTTLVPSFMLTSLPEPVRRALVITCAESLS